MSRGFCNEEYRKGEKKRGNFETAFSHHDSVELPEEFNLTIIHTNDVHAHFLESDSRGSPCTQPPCYGGMARV